MNVRSSTHWRLAMYTRSPVSFCGGQPHTTRADNDSRCLLAAPGARGGGGARRATEQDGFCISFPLEKCETRINLSKFKHVNLTRRSSKAKPLDRVSSIECDHISSSNSKRPAVLLLVSQKRKQFRCSSASQFLFPPDGERDSRCRGRNQSRSRQYYPS
jgi:hypothetical protein